MRVVLVCQYKGTNYNGFQTQPNGQTIQDELEIILKKIHKGQFVRIHMSGRTDAGVHALAQPVHFDTSLNIEPQGWVRSFNAQLPKDIRIIDAYYVADDFHVRYDVEAKTYAYRLSIAKILSPFETETVAHYPFGLNVERVRAAMPYFVGTHDFTSFCSKNSSVDNKVRTIHWFTLDQRGDELYFEINGDGFLYNMVRIIIGTLIQIGHGKYESDIVPTIIAAKDRDKAGHRAPACGLYLKEVFYN